MQDSVVVAQFGFRHEAEMAKSYLDDAGIPSVLSVDDSGGAFAGISFPAPARIRVRQDDVVRAQKVLEQAGML